MTRARTNTSHNDGALWEPDPLPRQATAKLLHRCNSGPDCVHRDSPNFKRDNLLTTELRRTPLAFHTADPKRTPSANSTHARNIACGPCSPKNTLPVPTTVLATPSQVGDR